MSQETQDSSDAQQDKRPLSDDVEVASGSNTSDDVVAPEAQPGVQNIEAVTISWTRTALGIAYILIWLTYFVEGMLSGNR